MKLKLIFIFLILGVSSLSYGQMTKEETKIWKSKMKDLDVQGFKNLVETKEEAVANVDKLSSDNQTLLDKVNTLEAENTKLGSDVEDYKKAANDAAEKLAAEKIKIDSTSGGTANTYGLYTRSAKGDLVYKVQIGAFKKFDITKYFNKHENFSGEIDDDGTMKYTLGEFADYWEADKFKQFLREMGVDGAWVVAYKAGKRVDMKAAREGL